MKVYYESKPGELEHGLFSKTFKPKYLKKVPNGKGGYRYLYTQAEVDAYDKAETQKARKKSAAIEKDKAERIKASKTPVKLQQGKEKARDRAETQRSRERAKEIDKERNEAIKAKLGGKTKVSKEYLEELAYNSQKNKKKKKKKKPVK